ncbi:MAG: hypothetical protein JJT77_09265 [Crocinitomicaceae bacterium]|nr:hypothetical protein [Crocinitomicaceae bacterium]
MTKENPNSKEKPKGTLGQWFGWIIATIIVIVICIKILLSDFDFSELQFGFTDLLSMLLALFAVWISINFYHKNNETSSKFYNNTYTFTKDISETLGRIEERFGEKLESLKEENKSLSTRVEKYYTGFGSKTIDKEKDEKKEKEIQQKLEKELEEKNKLLDQFTKKYKIAEQDRNQFIEMLNNKTEEVNRLERKLMLFEKNSAMINNKYNLPSRLVSYVKRIFTKDEELRRIFCIPDIMDEEEIKINFHHLSRRFNPGFISDLEKYDLINEERILTDFGLKVMTEIARNVEKLSA